MKLRSGFTQQPKDTGVEIIGPDGALWADFVTGESWVLLLGRGWPLEEDGILLEFADETEAAAFLRDRGLPEIWE